MRFIQAFLLSLFFVSALQAQPTWKAHIVTQHPYGFTDTVVVGCDSLGNVGFQVGLDVIDTIFDAPIAIGSYDPLVSAGSGCVNLSTDMRAFQDGHVIFPLYVKSTLNDSLGWNPWIIQWDSVEFDFEDDRYYLQEAYFESSNGYIGGIDNTRVGIALYSVALDSVRFHDPESNIIGLSGLLECNDLDNFIIRLDLYVGFNVFPVGLAEFPALQAKIYPNPFTDYLKVELPDRGNYSFALLSMEGKVIMESQCFSCEKHELQVSLLQSGTYFLYLADNLTGYSNGYLIQKLK